VSAELHNTKSNVNRCGGSRVAIYIRLRSHCGRQATLSEYVSVSELKETGLWLSVTAVDPELRCRKKYEIRRNNVPANLILKNGSICDLFSVGGGGGLALFVASVGTDAICKKLKAKTLIRRQKPQLLHEPSRIRASPFLKETTTRVLKLKRHKLTTVHYLLRKFVTQFTYFIVTGYLWLCSFGVGKCWENT
jgi:hypothetical protein